MKTLGFKKPQRFLRRTFFGHINATYTILTIIMYVFFSAYRNFIGFTQADNKIDIFTQNLQELSFYFLTIDKKISDILGTMDTVMQSFKQGENIRNKHEGEIEFLATSVQDQAERIEQIGGGEYKTLLRFLQKGLKFREEIYGLLAKDKPQKYLILLQNAAEKRPNGGFFGSFLIVTLANGQIKDFKIMDSYYPIHLNPYVYVSSPKRTLEFFDTTSVRFVGANKLGFTNIDGKNIKDLYELVFKNENIKGVIFLKSDLLEKLIPGFSKKMRERQFVNASIDLIRGENLPGKKELYMKDLEEYLKSHTTEIIKSFGQKFDEILNGNYLKIYLSNVSTGLNNFLQQHHLQTVPQKGRAYSREYNESYSKTDRFVEKMISIYDSKDNKVFETKKDIFEFPKLHPNKKYTMKIMYNFSIPEYYKEFIKSLEKKYSITLTDRERYILGLMDTRKNRSIVYLPKNIRIEGITGDVTSQKSFSTPFSHNAYFVIGSNKNHDFKIATISIHVKE